MSFFSQLRWITTAILFTAFGAFLMLIAFGTVYLLAEEPAPILLRDMPNTHSAVTPEFQRRLSAAFRKGTKEPALIAKLSSSGFTFHQTKDGTLFASYDGEAFICQASYVVEWQRKEDGSVSDVRGSYYASCL